MNILWLSEIFPYPPNNGFKVRMLNFICPLSQEHDITLIAATDTGEKPEDIAFMKQHCREVRAVTCALEQTQPDPARRSLPDAVRRFSFPALRQAVRDVLTTASFDVVVIEGIKMAQYLPSDFAGVSVLDTQDVETLRYRSTVRAKKGLRSKLWGYQEYRRWRCYETKALSQFDLCLCVSEHDGDIFRRWAPSANVRYLPIPIDTSECAPFLDTPEDEKLISFVGALNYYPNIDAILYFYHDMYPRVKRQVPGVKLLIVGRQPPAGVLSLRSDPSVTVVHENVADVKPFLARSAVSVAPVRLGGGTKVKILTAMSLGLPVVTTPHGLQGLCAQEGKEILVGRNTRAFAQHIVRLLHDPARRQSIGNAARSRIETHYAMEVVSQQLHELLTTALEQKRQCGRVGVTQG